MATCESPVVANCTAGTRLWLSHANGTISVWERERAQHLETLHNLAADGLPAVAVQLCSLGAARVLGVVRDAVVAWDASAYERLAAARGYAVGNSTALCAAFNTRMERYYAWTGHSDGSVCVWALRQAGLGMLPPDIVALRKRFPNMRVLTHDERERAVAESKSALLLSPRDSASMVRTLIAARWRSLARSLAVSVR